MDGELKFSVAVVMTVEGSVSDADSVCVREPGANFPACNKISYENYVILMNSCNLKFVRKI